MSHLKQTKKQLLWDYWLFKIWTLVFHDVRGKKQAVSLVTTQLHLKSSLTDDDAAGPLFFTDRLVGKHSSSLPFDVFMVIKRRKPLHLTACFGFGAHTETALLSFLHLGNFFHTWGPCLKSHLSALAWFGKLPLLPPQTKQSSLLLAALLFSQRDLRTNYLKALLSVVFDQIRTHQQWYN